MKKPLLSIVCFALAAGMLTGCSNPFEEVKSLLGTEEETIAATKEQPVTEAVTTEAETVTEAVTETTAQTTEATEAATTTEAVSNEPITLSLVNGECTMTLPASWNGRYAVQGDTVYCKQCMEQDATQEYGTPGALFSILLYDDMDITANFPNARLLGVSGGQYVVMMMPSDVNYDVSNAALVEEYNSMFSDLEDIAYSAVCASSPDFTPIDLGKYSEPYGNSNALTGSWELMSDQGVQFSPYITFRQRDAAFGFAYGLNGASCLYKTGHYIMKDGIENYQWNTDNWGEFGLIFLDGSIYRFTMYATAPTCVELELLAGISPGSELETETWYYMSEFEDFDVDYND